ncbi:MAG: DUF6443 domain-containing protein, partial [Bacteroidota bacterium]
MNIFQYKRGKASAFLQTSILSILSILSQCSSLFAQSNLAFEDNFSRPHLWEEIYLIPLNTSTGQLLTSDGDIHIDGEEVVYDDCGDQSDKRVYRKLGSPLGQSWTLDVDFTPTAGGPHGVGHIVAGLTAGTANPYNIVPETVTSSNPTFAPTEQDGIFLEYMSPLNGATSQYYLRVRSKDGTTYHTPVNAASYPFDGRTFYLRMSMNSSGSLTFEVFDDAARAPGDLLASHSLSVPSSVTGLNVLQHSNIPQGSYNRKLTATVDNVKLYDSSMPCVRCEDYSQSLTASQNYVMSKTARVAASSAAEMDALSNTADSWTDIAYVDGLGRPLQEISIGAAPDCQGDMVQYHQYDAFGREALADLPYVDAGLTGSFRDDGNGGLPTGDQRDFYDPPSTPNFPHIPSNDLAVPFAETVFEASPLNRVMEQGAPGADWQVGNPGNNLHTVRTSYRSNQAFEVYDFGLSPVVGSGNSIGFFPAGELMVQETRDEHDIRSWTFVDKQGRVILQQREVTGTDLRTYTIYNEQGLPVLVLQPKGTEELQGPYYGGSDKLSQAVVDDFAFQYEYDIFGRVIRKKVPGADWVELVYNNLDQLVLTQDGNQRNNGGTNEWSFTKYDALGRPVMTGIYASDDDRSTLQTTLDGETQLVEVRDGSNFSSQHGYSNQAYPTNNLSIHSVTYYDDYDYDRDGSGDVAYQADLDNFSGHQPDLYTRGLVTGVRVWILDKDSDMPESLLTTTFYDNRGREIQTIADNHLNGTDITWYEYDFAGQLLFSKHEHIGHDGTGSYAAYERSATVYKSFTYDPRGRLIRTEQKTEDPDNSENETDFVTLSEQRYDKLGQMSQKNLHYKAGENFLQLGDYEYNIRGWLTKFNDVFVSPLPGAYTDLFSLELSYNGGTTAQYNGNIAAMTWKQTDGYGHYDFSYDQANRLTGAVHDEIGATGGLPDGRYTVSNISYDKNGNILSLDRQGKISSTTFGDMDELSYTYSGNRLMKVDDAGLSTYLTDVEQFVDGNTSGDDYDYDHNGNLTEDLNKGITNIIYNHLNKPTKVFKGQDYIEYIYSADGTKLKQKVYWVDTEQNPPVSSFVKYTDYLGGFHYEDSDGEGSADTEMLFFSHEEGRVRRAGTELVYEMFLRDHLGNNRVMFFDDNEDGWVDPASEVLQEDHFYPFGLRMAGASSVGSPAVPNQYLFTGKEFQDELEIGWIDFGA